MSINSCNSVFLALKEAFPQVDVRILKATAIEHYKATDAAIEFILTEVLPCTTELSQSDCFSKERVEEENKNLLTRLRTSDCENDCNVHSELGQPDSVQHELDDKEISESPSIRSQELNVLATCPLSFSSHNKACDQDESRDVDPNFNLSYGDLYACHEAQTGSFSLEKHTDYSAPFVDCLDDDGRDLEMDSTLFLGGPSYEPKALCVASLNPAISYQPCFLESDVCSKEFKNLKESLQACVAELGEPLKSSQESDKDCVSNSTITSSVDSFSPTRTANQSRKNLNNEVHENDTRIPIIDDPAILSYYPLLHETSRTSSENGDSEEKNDKRCDSRSKGLPQCFMKKTLGIRSGHILDFGIEDLLNDAKKSKETLVSAMNSVVSLIKMAELREEEAFRAKNEALKAGSDIFAKIEDLKKMLIHGRETNNMHAGEIYGEKSILATEARELQSRLLSLADERDKKLTIIEEMRRTLEARIAAAEIERIAAEEERSRKEEQAREALNEHENLMDNVVNESQKLKQQAEENNKLRECLVDRGRVVDMLQGEISVICEDVMSLKQAVDGSVAFHQFLRSRPTSLTSSTSSRASNLPGKNREDAELSDSLGVFGKDLTESQILDGEVNVGELSDATAPEKQMVTSYDEGWELFDGVADLN